MDATESSTRYDVDSQYAFVPPQEPLKRLPVPREEWESLLDAATGGKLTHGEHIPQLSPEQQAVELKKSALWREAVEQTPVLPTDDLVGNESQLRRAHHVLAYLAQFYAHTQSLTSSISIPRSVTVPLLRVSKELQIAPFLTYWDHALYNFALLDRSRPLAGDNIVSLTLFTDTADENELYMIDLRLELAGAVALEQLRLVAEDLITTSSQTLDESLITTRLQRAAASVDAATHVLKTTHKLISPDTFFSVVAPWLRGQNLDPMKRVWQWEGADEVPGSAELLRWVDSPNAGQSPLFPAIDAYLGVAADDGTKKGFVEGMLPYMLRGHREYIQHLRSNGCPIRTYVEGKRRGERGEEVSDVVAAYNELIDAVKRFRTAHLAIVTQYVVIPARKMFAAMQKQEGEASGDSSAQTAGDGASPPDELAGLMGLLKGFRDGTESSTVS